MNYQDIVYEERDQIATIAINRPDVMNAFRLTLVGEGQGPGMFDISAFLGKEETLRRLRKAIEVLG